MVRPRIPGRRECVARRNGRRCNRLGRKRIRGAWYCAACYDRTRRHPWNQNAENRTPESPANSAVRFDDRTHCAWCTMCEHLYERHRVALCQHDVVTVGEIAACRCCALNPGAIPVRISLRTSPRCSLPAYYFIGDEKRNDSVRLCYAARITERTGLRDSEVQCPREKSFSTPCVARDGGLAVTLAIHGGICVGFERTVGSLLNAERAL